LIDTIDTAEDEYKQKILKDGAEAAKLLTHPMLQSFLKSELSQCFEVFCGMPASSTLEDFKYLQSRVDVVKKLESSLRSHIGTAEDLKLRDQLPDEV